MAFDEKLADRIRRALADRRDVEEKKMFGGLTFMVGGHMCVGIVDRDLMARIGPDASQEALARPHVREMDFTGRALKGMVYVASAGVRSEAALMRWIDQGVEFVSSLPPKKKKLGKQLPSGGLAAGQAATNQGPTAETFEGFSPSTFRFLRGIDRHNNKRWFEEHREEYSKHYVSPATAFVSALGPRLRKISKSVKFEPKLNGSVFRIQRDMRFVGNGAPYKPHLDLLFWEGQRRGFESSNFFLRLAPGALTLGVGIQRFERKTLADYRSTVVDGRKGPALERLIRKLEKSGCYEIKGATRKALPRGFDPKHRRANLLLHDGLYAVLEQHLPPETRSPEFVDWCLQHFSQLAPVHRRLLELG